MSQQMLNQLHNEKLSGLNKDQPIPWEDVPMRVRADMVKYRNAQDLCSRLSQSIRAAGYEPDSGRENIRRPYDWSRKEKSDRIQKLSTLKTVTRIALMKCEKNKDRALVMERYIKAIGNI